MMETKLGQIMEAILLMRVLFLSVDLIMFVSDGWLPPVDKNCITFKFAEL